MTDQTSACIDLLVDEPDNDQPDPVQRTLTFAAWIAAGGVVAGVITAIRGILAADTYLIWAGVFLIVVLGFALFPLTSRLEES